MNNKTAYEILIAEKASQVPVPDMADAIWASIEAQLDAAPGDEADVHQPPSEKLPANRLMPGNKMLLLIISIAAIVVLLFLFTKNIRKKTGVKKVPVQQEQEKQPAKNIVMDTVSDISSARKLDPPGQYQPVKDGFAPVIIRPAEKDSISNQPFKNTPDDSVALPGRMPLVIQRDSITTLPPPSKKPRGLKGIEDGDYKISGGKRDSLKK